MFFEIFDSMKLETASGFKINFYAFKQEWNSSILSELRQMNSLNSDFVSAAKNFLRSKNFKTIGHLKKFTEAVVKRAKSAFVMVQYGGFDDLDSLLSNTNVQFDRAIAIEQPNNSAIVAEPVVSAQEPVVNESSQHPPPQQHIPQSGSFIAPYQYLH